ncbi:hypothetical protein IAR50_000281 [Cryptococcus sp. DSM 104548]
MGSSYDLRKPDVLMWAVQVVERFETSSLPEKYISDIASETSTQKTTTSEKKWHTGKDGLHILPSLSGEIKDPTIGLDYLLSQSLGYGSLLKELSGTPINVAFRGTEMAFFIFITEDFVIVPTSAPSSSNATSSPPNVGNAQSVQNYFEKLTRGQRLPLDLRANNRKLVLEIKHIRSMWKCFHYALSELCAQIIGQPFTRILDPDTRLWSHFKRLGVKDLASDEWAYHVAAIHGGAPKAKWSTGANLEANPRIPPLVNSPVRSSGLKVSSSESDPKSPNEDHDAIDYKMIVATDRPTRPRSPDVAAGDAEAPAVGWLDSDFPGPRDSVASEEPKPTEEEEDMLRTLGARAVLRQKEVRVCQVSIDIFKRLVEECLSDSLKRLALAEQVEARRVNPDHLLRPELIAKRTKVESVQARSHSSQARLRLR